MDNKENVHNLLASFPNLAIATPKKEETAATVSEPSELGFTTISNTVAKRTNSTADAELSIHDFDFIKPISKGAFGTVYLGRKTHGGDHVYAIKRMGKRVLARKNMAEQVVAERDALALVNSEYVVRIYYSLQSRECVYLVMEYLPGGDLASLLCAMGCLDEDMARFYTAQLVAALDYLHSHHIIHRDIKPDNLLIDADGHLKLSDFGLARIARGVHSFGTPPLRTPGQIRSLAATLHFETTPLGTRTPGPGTSSRRVSVGQRQRVIGTPDYLAPEAVLGQPVDAPADWWAVGVCLYEFLTGVPPFTAQDPPEVFHNITHNAVDFTDWDSSTAAMDLIDQLLQKGPRLRPGPQAITAHPFFNKADFATLRSRPAPFIPAINDITDTSYFERMYSLPSHRITLQFICMYRGT